MSKKKNFFYRVNPETVLSELTSINHDEWLQFFLNFFHDLRADDPNNSKTAIASKIIKESHNFRELRSKAGKASVQQKSTNVQHMLKDVQPVAVAVTVLKQKTLSEYSDDFKLFWEMYPNKTGKGKAYESWKKQKPSLEKIVKALEWQTASEQWLKDDGQYIPNPTTYLNQKRWEDAPKQLTNKTRCLGDII